MKVNQISFIHFRNLQQATLTPSDGVNVIYGENAQGKTNTMEAIWLFTGIKSFRATKDTPLICNDQTQAKLDMEFETTARQQSAQIVLGEKKEYLLNGVKKKNAADFAGHFTAVVFSPDHLPLVKNGPAERRRFMNTAISQLWPQYMPVLYAYSRAVQQRNSVLRDARYHTDLLNLLDSYECEIAKKGMRIISYRNRFCTLLKEKATAIYDGIAGGRETFSMQYTPCAENEEQLMSSLKEAQRSDMQSGTTSVGPHRDDLLFTIDGLNARQFASQGQQRSIVVTLKLAEAEVLQSISGEQPVILLDDVMSELDLQRQDYILNHIRNQQVFLTCCEKATADRLKSGALFHVRGGAIEC